jgi:type I restriction enzyme R subunit
MCLNTKNNEWCKNEFQVTHQVTMVGKYENRYDVTLLINGLPLVQIELKRRGIDFKEAFNQVIRYKKHSLNDLFRYVQIFIISNGIDTKYFANSDKEMDFQYTFYWTDKNNNRIDNLYDFALDFLPKCHISKMISRYMVVDDTQKNLMVMRPYQYYAVEELMKRAYETNNNAYVWHTTGSGKTLTSFKLSQLLSTNREVAQVFFLVDRKDLDSQTIEEFNRFQKDTVDMTDSTDTLIAQMKDSSKKIILTTIQKMSNACKNDKYQDVIDRFEGKKVVFIIDECHRSQFGEMHKMIKKKFPRAQYFGFTGTPRFAENASQDGRTTADIFEKLVHHYLIKNAIADGNVLGFNVDYVRTISSTVDIEDDEEVEAIDTEEVLMDDQRISNIVDYVLKIHNSKTNNRRYNAIFTVRSIPMLIKYYDEFKKRNTDLKIAGIFTFGANEDGELETEHSRDSLERMINDYNQMFDKNYSTNTFSAYFTDVSKKVKNTELDILLVVNMFLTGFDAKRLNTLYVDKRLKHHDLIQAFSRTNRIETANKPYGNIVCFQTNKKAVDDAVKLFSLTDNADEVLMKPYEYYRDEFRKAVEELLKHTPSPEEAEHGGDEQEEYKFVLLFRELVRLMVKLKTFDEFEFTEDELGMSNQLYEDFVSKYKKIYRDIRPDQQKASILSDVSFDIELLRNDKINVHYILELIKNAVSEPSREKRRKTLDEIEKMIESATDPELYMKSDLIHGFIDSIASEMDPDADFEYEYNQYMEEQRTNEIREVAAKYQIPEPKINRLIGDYEFGGFVDKNDIKTDLTKDVIKREKEENNFSSSMRAKNSITNTITQFIKDVVIKYM